MKKPETVLPPLPAREALVHVETADEVLQPPLKHSAAISSSRVLPTESPQSGAAASKPAQSKRPKPAQPDKPEENEVRETTTRFSTWLYPSQIKRLQDAALDYERRHPKRRPSIGIAGLVRIAVDLVPESGKELDEFIEKAMR